MPLYTYICPNDHEEEVVFSVHSRRPRTLPCRECRQPATRLFKPPQVICMTPYVTRAGDGTATEIRSPSQERAYEKMHGLSQITDTDLKTMRDGLSGQKDRIRKRKSAEQRPFSEDYAEVKAEMDSMGAEHKKEQAGKEIHDMANAIE